MRVVLIKEIQSFVLQHATLKQMGRHVKAQGQAHERRFFPGSLSKGYTGAPWELHISVFQSGRAWRMACYSCPCTAWNVSAGCLLAVFAQLFHTKKAKNVCRAIFVMLSWLAAVHIDFAAVSSTVMPLFQMF
ncbi:hypothetical protein [Desulfovibrio falkowii]|uniref:hypothetical protein n=1 Tax=Desulfovibrio sp. WGS1351 TaxID=3366814 RepID=UPI00372D15A3